jgi:hypothetical protein
VDLYCVLNGRSNHKTEECFYNVNQKEWVQSRRNKQADNINAEVTLPQDNEKLKILFKRVLSIPQLVTLLVIHCLAPDRLEPALYNFKPSPYSMERLGRTKFVKDDEIFINEMFL